MSYTVGIKRRFWPGYRLVQVTGHSWENFRFILNLTDGSQIVIPGFQAGGIKVYPDFKSHIAVLEDARRKADEDLHQRHLELEARYRKQAEYEAHAHAEYQRVREFETVPESFPEQPPQQQPWLSDQAPRRNEQDLRARENAKQRVSSILSGNGPSEGLADRPSIGGSIQ